MPHAISKDHFSAYSLKALFSDPEKLMPYMTGLHYDAGEIMVCDFYAEAKLCIITEGRFNLYALQANGNQLLLRSCEAVMLAGENELIMHAYPDLRDNQTKDFYIEMLTDCTMIVLQYRSIRDLLLSDNQFLRIVCHSLVEKSMHFADLEVTSSLTSAESRVAGYLLKSADEHGEWHSNQKIAAEELRMSYRHLHRVLKVMIEDGCIIRITGGYKIADRGKLKNYLA